ncbi:MAG TPA: hypothetical protein VMW54_11815 [Terriglobia bacterium]|nr:hypothetical protein [Terriglobia bacterium]
MKEFQDKISNELAIIDGTPPHWSDVQIEETPESVLTNPLNERNYWRRHAGDYDGVRHFPHGGGDSLISRLEKIAARHPARPRRNYIHDRAASAEAKYLPNPREPVKDALARLEISLANRQADPSFWPYWTVLKSYAAKLPSGSLVRDMDRDVLNLTISRLVEGKI